jgi:hypothetical protein
LPAVILVVSLVPAIMVVSLVPATPVASVAPAVTVAPVSAAIVDHRRRRIIRGRLIDDRRRVSSKDERIDADTDTHLRACGRGRGKRKSGED